MLVNNFSTGLISRQLIWELVSQDQLIVDEATLLERSMEKSRPHSPCGLILSLAESLGAERDSAMCAASFVEFFFAALDLIDDIQDGDSETYLKDVSLPLQINLGIQLIALAYITLADLEKRCPQKSSGEFTKLASILYSTIVSGQFLELNRKQWSLESYKKMARLSAGNQLELYFRVAAMAAGDIDASPLLQTTQPLGILMDIACDKASQDSRLKCLPPVEIEKLWHQNLAELNIALDKLPKKIRKLLDGLLKMDRKN